MLKTAESLNASQVGARLLPASPFLRSLSLKARIEMILESRFAPHVSSEIHVRYRPARISRLALVRSDHKRWKPGQAQVMKHRRRPGKPDTPATSEFPYAVRFEQGATRFLDGDKITILEVRGTADTFAPGNIYWIKGTYTLASHDRAMLAAYITAMDAANGTSVSTQGPDDRRQSGQRYVHAFPADVMPGLAACQFLPGRRRRSFRRQLFWNGRFCPEAVVGDRRDGSKSDERAGKIQ